MMEHVQNIRLPAWIHDVLENGDPTDEFPNKRTETRRIWTESCFAEREGNPVGSTLMVRGFNVGCDGIGLIAREGLPVGQRLKLTPRSGPGEPVLVRVIHCTQTLLGYKVGCVFESTDEPGSDEP